MKEQVTGHQSGTLIVGEGRERAKGRGVRMGRKHKLTPHQQEEVRKRKAEGQSVRESILQRVT